MCHNGNQLGDISTVGGGGAALQYFSGLFGSAGWILGRSLQTACQEETQVDLHIQTHAHHMWTNWKTCFVGVCFTAAIQDLERPFWLIFPAAAGPKPKTAVVACFRSPSCSRSVCSPRCKFLKQSFKIICVFHSFACQCEIYFDVQIRNAINCFLRSFLYLCTHYDGNLLRTHKTSAFFLRNKMFLQFVKREEKAERQNYRMQQWTTRRGLALDATQIQHQLLCSVKERWGWGYDSEKAQSLHVWYCWVAFPIGLTWVVLALWS